MCGEHKPFTHYATLKSKTCNACLAAFEAKKMASEDANPPDLPELLPLPVAHRPKISVAAPGTDESPPAPPPGMALPSPDAGDVFISPRLALPDPEKAVDPSDIIASMMANSRIAARTLAQRDLLEFIKMFKPKYSAGWVHEDICRRLRRFVQEVEEGKEPRLLLMMPVRHGKSEIASRHFAPWVLGKHPDWEIIAASGAQSLAMSFSRYIRELVRDPAYQYVFPHTKLDPSSQSAENWNTTYGGGYLAAGIGTMITGRGAHILVIDDPVKDAEAADSQVIRDAVWEWYMSTALTRLAPGGGVLGIMTWWNEDDWAGRIQQVMATGDGDKFEIVKYPAVNEVGDEYILSDGTIAQITPGSPAPAGSALTRVHNTALHPARYTLEMLLRRRANYYALGQQRWWSALYQQNPTPTEGAFFTKDMFVEYTHAPRREGLSVYQGWDFAITEKQKSDYTVAVTGLVDEYDTMYILDVWRFKTEDGIELGTAIMTYARQWDATQVAVEDGQIWKAIKANFEKACDGAKYYPSYEIIVPLTDKRTRAQPARGRMQQKKIQFPLHAPWYPEFKSELLRFEAGGRHDDQVDALAHLVRLATTKSAPSGPRRAKEPEGWASRLRRQLFSAEGSAMSA